MSANSNPPEEEREPEEDSLPSEPTDADAEETETHQTLKVSEEQRSGETTLPAYDQSTPDIPGLVIGEVLGAGAMGEVFAGRQEYLNRDVAVKMLGARCSGESYQTRFKREATLLAGLTHENIVACYDAGIAPDGRCFLVMERVLGPSLRTWVAENGPLSPEAAVRVVMELARALQHAHRNCTLIHRDVKPANVLLAPLNEPTGDGFPFAAKLADLGLARPADAECVDMALTADGVILGTPSTMAPEQFDDPKGVDRRADIYALGCVLYYALTGESAFRGRSLSQIVQAKLSGDAPNAAELRPETPRSLALLAKRMMAARAEDRPQTYQALLQACSSLDDPVERDRRTPNKWTLIVIGIVVILGGAIGYNGLGGSSPSPRKGGEAPGNANTKVAEAPAKEEGPAENADRVARTTNDLAEEADQEGDEEVTQPKEASEQDPAPVAMTPPSLEWPGELLVQAGDPVLLNVLVSDPGDGDLLLAWQWNDGLGDGPPLTYPSPHQVRFDAPVVQSLQTFVLEGSATYAEGQDAILHSCQIHVYPTAPPLSEELSLIVAADYGNRPRHWTHLEGGTQFGQLSADEGLYCRSIRNRTLNGITLPGGDWGFQGTLAVSEGDPIPERLGVVITFPHGRRHEWLVTEPEGLVISQAYALSEAGSEWQPDGNSVSLGSATIGESGLPVSVTWSRNRLTIEAGDAVVFSTHEPIAPKTLAFSVQGGAGELRVPKLLPGE